MLLLVSLLSSGAYSFVVLFGQFSLSSTNFILKPFGQVSNSPPTFPVRWTPSLARNSLFWKAMVQENKFCFDTIYTASCSRLISYFPCQTHSLQLEKELKKQHLLFLLFPKSYIQNFKIIKDTHQFCLTRSFSLTWASRKVKIHVFDVF